MPVLACDSGFERGRIVAVGEHVAIVVAFEQQSIATGQTQFDVPGGNADVGQKSEAPAAVGKDKLNWIAGVVRHRKRPHLEPADLETIMAVETAHAGETGEAFLDQGKRPEGKPHWGLIPARERGDAAD